jgi:hypothetical protein
MRAMSDNFEQIWTPDAQIAKAINCCTLLSCLTCLLFLVQEGRMYKADCVSFSVLTLGTSKSHNFAAKEQNITLATSGTHEPG